jgi:hypothetical protein
MNYFDGFFKSWKIREMKIFLNFPL